MMVINYKINDRTMAILPVHSKEYASKVYEFEQDKMLTFKEEPIKMIDRNCKKHFSSHAGRRASVLYHTSYKKKTPIPISSTKGIIAFPTQGLTNINCAWIFYRHVDDVEERNGGCAVIFKNGTELFQPISKDRILRQIDRCKNLGNIIKNSEESEKTPSPNFLNLPEGFLIAHIEKLAKNPPED